MPKIFGQKYTFCTFLTTTVRTFWSEMQWAEKGVFNFTNLPFIQKVGGVQPYFCPWKTHIFPWAKMGFDPPKKCEIKCLESRKKLTTQYKFYFTDADARGRGWLNADICGQGRSQKLAKFCGRLLWMAPYSYCFSFININTVTRSAHDIRTCVP